MRKCKFQILITSAGGKNDEDQTKETKYDLHRGQKATSEQGRVSDFQLLI